MRIAAAVCALAILVFLAVFGAVLAQKATGVLFVMGAERVSRHLVHRALEQLGNVEARMVGGILTRVDLKRNAYYYSKYYHPEYSEYATPASTGS